MEFSYRMTKEIWLDAFDLCYWKAARKAGASVLVGASIFSLAVLAIFALDDLRHGKPMWAVLISSDGQLTLTMFAICGAVLAWGIMFPRWKAQKSYRNSPIDDAVVNVSITDQHFEVNVNTGASSCFDWKFYKCWRENSKIFAIISKSGQYQFLPKGGLNKDQLDGVRSMLGAHLPRK